MPTFPSMSLSTLVYGKFDEKTMATNNKKKPKEPFIFQVKCYLNMVTRGSLTKQLEN